MNLNNNASIRQTENTHKNTHAHTEARARAGFIHSYVTHRSCLYYTYIWWNACTCAAPTNRFGLLYFPSFFLHTESFMDPVSEFVCVWVENPAHTQLHTRTVQHSLFISNTLLFGRRVIYKQKHTNTHSLTHSRLVTRTGTQIHAHISRAIRVPKRVFCVCELCFHLIVRERTSRATIEEREKKCHKIVCFPFSFILKTIFDTHKYTNEEEGVERKTTTTASNQRQRRKVIIFPFSNCFEQKCDENVWCNFSSVWCTIQNRMWIETKRKSKVNVIDIIRSDIWRTKNCLQKTLATLSVRPNLIQFVRFSLWGPCYCCYFWWFYVCD